MNQGLSGTSLSNNEAGLYFSPEDYFLGIVSHIAKSRGSARISLPGNGEIAMFSDRGEFHAKVQDMAEFCQAPASDFEVVALKDHRDGQRFSQFPSGKTRELLWTAAFHASQGRLDRYRSDNGLAHVYDVVSFTHWPNLTRLPVTSNTMRICALLARHPTSIGLVPRKLHIKPEEVYQVYSAANSYGIVNCLNPHTGQSDPQNDNMLDEQADLVQKQRNLLQLLFDKISGL